jgi:phosphoribosylamine-glycine ligase
VAEKGIAKIFNTKQKRKFFVLSSYGELLDLAIRLKQEKEEVVLHIPNADSSKIGDGIVDKADNWHEYLNKGYIFVVDGCETAKLQDWLRDNGELVVGTNVEMASLEEDRQKGQALFKKAGFNQPASKNFTDFDDAIAHVQDSDARLILKQNGSAPKSLNHMGKFDGGVDMLFHLNELKKSWSEAEFGPIDFDLMEVVEGTEIAASAFFNGHDWLRDSKGHVVGFLNIEHKKHLNDDLGETTGETGTLFIGVDDTDELFKDILLRPEIVKKLKDTSYRGVFDINGSVTESGFVAFEPTSRFGIPATSYEFIEGLDMKTADLLEYMAKGEDKTISLHKGYGMVVVVFAPPYPIEADVEDRATSLGEKLWPLNDGEPKEDFSPSQFEHIHLQNFRKDDDGHYRVATKNGYLLTITGRGENIESLREGILEYIKENLYLSDMGYRTDIGKKFDENY